MKDIKDNPILSVLIAVSMVIGGGGAYMNSGGLKAEDVAAAEKRLTTIELNIQQIASDRETMSKHWKLHQWAKDEVNALRAKHDLDASRWPDF